MKKTGIVLTAITMMASLTAIAPAGASQGELHATHTACHTPFVNPGYGCATGAVTHYYTSCDSGGCDTVFRYTLTVTGPACGRLVSLQGCAPGLGEVKVRTGDSAPIYVTYGKHSHYADVCVSPPDGRDVVEQCRTIRYDYDVYTGSQRSSAPELGSFLLGTVGALDPVETLGTAAATAGEVADTVLYVATHTSPPRGGLPVRVLP